LIIIAILIERKNILRVYKMENRKRSSSIILTWEALSWCQFCYQWNIELFQRPQ